eukprot:12017493-Alexandrium_andersonii.AAC.1
MTGYSLKSQVGFCQGHSQLVIVGPLRHGALAGSGDPRESLGRTRERSGELWRAPESLGEPWRASESFGE